MTTNTMNELLSMKDELARMSSQVDMMICEFADLNEIYEREIFRSEQVNDGVVSDFINEIKSEFYGLRYIPDVFLYEKYKLWHVATFDPLPYSERQFKLLVEREMKRIGYVAPYDEVDDEYGRVIAYRKTRKFDVLNSIRDANDCFAYLQAISNFTLEDKYENETYYELESDYITKDDINRVYTAIELNHPLDLNAKNNLIYDILKVAYDLRR